MDQGQRVAVWSAAPAIDWLLREGRLIQDSVRLVDALASRLLDAGAPLWRMRLGFFTNHPQLAAWAHIWTRGQPTRIERIPHGVQRTGAYIGSPAQKMVESGGAVRYRLDDLSPSDHPVLHELAAAGGRDYLLLPLQFSDGSRNVLALATDEARGFTGRDLENFEILSHPLAAVLEVAATHRAAEILLDTYVGHRTGQRILNGQIHRGDADTIQAAIWYADLRDFSRLSESLPAPRVLEMLNAYFETVAAAAAAHGGEILRFVGDAMLIVFAADAERDLDRACNAAADAALQAFSDVAALNGRRLQAGAPEIRFGVGLSAGEVVYGNVGAPDRLDFTVIGPIVNLAARLETATKDLGVSLLMTAAVAHRLDRPVRSLGSHRMRGVEDPVEVFALAP